MKNLSFFLIVLILLVINETRAAEVNNATLQDYEWNWFLWYISVSKLIKCNSLGLWGLFWLDDNGLLAEKCFQSGVIGGRASFSGYPQKPKKKPKKKTATDDSL